MNEKILICNTQEQALSGIILTQIRGGINKLSHASFLKNDVHTHNHYLFNIQEYGESHVVVDFKEYKQQGLKIVCILPGQTHFNIYQKNVKGWIFGIDTLFVTAEQKETLDLLLFSENAAVPDAELMNELNSCLNLLNKKIFEEQEISRQIAYSLATSATGIIAEIYKKQKLVPHNKKLTDIVRSFKLLLSAHFLEKKKPSQYADMLGITPQYFNRIVKRTTGFTAEYWIQHEVMLEAKRLLFHTSDSIKKIAFHLGYDDYAYFTRLFTKVCGITPIRFREIYHE
jgi:AraC-like DNA-binding protein